MAGKNKCYDPAADEAALSYLFCDGMTVEEKRKALADALWEATNANYGDAMANKLASGIEDAQTAHWEQSCKNRSAISRLYKFYKEAYGNGVV